MLRKIICVVLTLMLGIILCGCDFFATNTAELLSPPALSGELNEINKAIKNSAEGDYTLKYPSRGAYRSAVVREDINGDGILEAFAFYSTTDGETTTMNVSYIRNSDNEWEAVAQQKIVAGGVDMIEFCDLDSDGIREVLVGWEIYGTSEMQLAVYSVTENSLTQRMLQRYTHFITCNLNEDGKNEVLIVRVGFAEQVNNASLFEISENGVTEISSCELDNAAKTVNIPVVSKLSTGKPAIYIDEIKGVGAITEVLFMEKGALVNPLFQHELKETISTLRSASYATRDINNDGLLEIPVQENLPSVTKSQLNEKLYMINWCTFNGEILTNQLVTIINAIDSYYYVIPAKWVGSIAVLKDTDNNVREIYKYNAEDMTVGESLLYIRAVKKSDWDAGKYEDGKTKEIMNNGEITYICRISDVAAAEGLTIERVKADFKLFE